jgi:Na+-transporting NADH:ubiquinone oxidoreductase subunit NqrE
LTYKTRKNLSLCLPNIAVCCWIGANAIWMLGEFFDFNHIPYSLFLFVGGMLTIAYYFAIAHKAKQSTKP